MLSLSSCIYIYVCACVESIPTCLCASAHTHVYCGLYLKLTRLPLSGHPNYCVRPSPSEFYYLFILFYFIFILETLQNIDSLGRIVSYAALGLIGARLSWLRKVPEVIYRSYMCVRLHIIYLHEHIFILYINVCVHRAATTHTHI